MCIYYEYILHMYVCYDICRFNHFYHNSIHVFIILTMHIMFVCIYLCFIDHFHYLMFLMVCILYH